MKLSLLPLFTFLLSLLSGCASVPQRPELPESIGNDGLVVAEVQGLGRLALFGYADVIIKGGKSGKLAGSYLAHALPPGQYTLEALRQTSPGGSSSVTGVTVTTTNIATLPIKIDFTVRAGEVTNLGQLLLVPNEKDPQKKLFAVHAVDNTADMRYFLQTFYPKLYASLGKATMTLAPGKYTQGQELQRLRRYIALKRGGSMASRLRYVAGPAGTLAVLDRAADGSVKEVRLLDSPVIASVRHEAEQQAYDRFAFTTSDNRFFIVKAGQVEARSLPIEKPDGLFLFRDRGVVVIDDKFNLYTSNDDGRSWQHYAGAIVDASQSSWHDGLTEDRDGYYTYRHFPPRLAYAKYGSAEYQPVALPKDATNIRRLTARQSGLFLEKEVAAWSSNTPHPFFVRARAGDEWQIRHKPRAMCDLFEFLDESGQQLRVRCSGEVYESSDGGVIWRR